MGATQLKAISTLRNESSHLPCCSVRPRVWAPRQESRSTFLRVSDIRKLSFATLLPHTYHSQLPIATFSGHISRLPAMQDFENAILRCEDFSEALKQSITLDCSSPLAS